MVKASSGIASYQFVLAVDGILRRTRIVRLHRYTMKTLDRTRCYTIVNVNPEFGFTRASIQAAQSRYPHSRIVIFLETLHSGENTSAITFCWNSLIQYVSQLQLELHLKEILRVSNTQNIPRYCISPRQACCMQHDRHRRAMHTLLLILTNSILALPPEICINYVVIVSSLTPLHCKMLLTPSLAVLLPV